MLRHSPVRDRLEVAKVLATILASFWVTAARREVFYWLCVFTTFALGTTAGDFTAKAWRRTVVD